MANTSCSVIRKLEVGPMCDRISEQLAGCLFAHDAARLDADLHAINRLYLGGYIREREFDRAAKQLMAKAQVAVTDYSNRPRAGA